MPCWTAIVAVYSCYNLNTEVNARPLLCLRDAAPRDQDTKSILRSSINRSRITFECKRVHPICRHFDFSTAYLSFRDIMCSVVHGFFWQADRPRQSYMHGCIAPFHLTTSLNTSTCKHRRYLLSHPRWLGSPSPSAATSISIKLIKMPIAIKPTNNKGAEVVSGKMTLIWSKGDLGIGKRFGRQARYDFPFASHAPQEGFTDVNDDADSEGLCSLTFTCKKPPALVCTGCPSTSPSRTP